MGVVSRLVSIKVAAALLVVCCATTEARASFFRDVVRGLQFGGFTVQGQKNILTDGAEVSITQTFFGQPIDFGVTELSLSGTLRSQVIWGRKPIPTFEFFMDTANAPLSYMLRRNTGMEDFLAQGDININALAEVNGLGFYDLIVNITNNGEFETEGLFGEGGGTLEFDVGPINVSGHIFADLLGSLLAPVFEARGETNPFREFSLRATRERSGIDAAEIEQIEQKLVDGEQITSEEASLLVTDDLIRKILGQGGSLESLLSGQAGSLMGEGGGAAILGEPVPEPTALMLLGAGLCCALRRRG